VKLAVPFFGILAIMLGWAYLAFQWPGPQPAIMYVYIPVVVSLVAGSALYWLWSRNSN
jgi:hypothetical protein